MLLLLLLLLRITSEILYPLHLVDFLFGVCLLQTLCLYKAT
jgi:hypothetical protein